MAFSITAKRAEFLRAVRDGAPVPTQNNRFGGQSDQPAGQQLRRAGLWHYTRVDGRIQRALTPQGSVVLRQYEKRVAAGDETPLKLYPRRDEG